MRSTWSELCSWPDLESPLRKSTALIANGRSHAVLQMAIEFGQTALVNKAPLGTKTDGASSDCYPETLWVKQDVASGVVERVCASPGLQGRSKKFLPLPMVDGTSTWLRFLNSRRQTEIFLITKTVCRSLLGSSSATDITWSLHYMNLMPWLRMRGSERCCRWLMLLPMVYGTFYCWW